MSSRFDALFDALTKTKADELRLVIGERIHILRKGQKQDIGKEPLKASNIDPLVLEVLGAAGVKSIRETPATQRIEHLGAAFFVTFGTDNHGATIAIRPEAKGAAPAILGTAATHDPAAMAPESDPTVRGDLEVAPARVSPVPTTAGHARPTIAQRPKDNARTPVGMPVVPVPDEAPESIELAHSPIRVATAEVAAPVHADTIDLSSDDDLPPIFATRAVPESSNASNAAKAPHATPGVATPNRAHSSLLDEILREMLQKKASDLHLSADVSPVYRVHGEIHFTDRPKLSSDEIFAMLEPIFSEKAKVDFAQNNDADFAYELPGEGRFRVNAFRDRKGVGSVMRQIPVNILTAEQLGLPKSVLDLCYLSKGLVVVTGPTGSGKSTTLAAMIDFINKNRSDHIITIEDPVEFVHPNIKCLVNQREIGMHTRSFKNALRAALREDPDIVLVGEMRDLETISIAMETAETGHLVFGTLHTTTAVSTVDRIIDQFPTDQQAQIRVMLSESLKGVVAQVLCKKAGGGRVAALEVMLANTAVAALIRDSKTFQISSVMQTQKGAGMITMNDSLLTLVQTKQVAAMDAYVKAVDKTGLLMMFKNAGIASPI
jgi:twitching motility protein PilT